jgi:hypothetical protein
MDKIIAYVDDADYALHQLAPMLNAPGASPVQWILVACPPRMSRHISKWVNRAARESWRNKWADKLFQRIVPSIKARGDAVVTLLPQGPLVETTQELQAKYGAARVLDARRPKLGQDMPPVTPDQPGAQDTRWAVPGAITGMAAFLVLATELATE